MLTWGMTKTWGFYGRQQELTTIEKICRTGRWYFCHISGRRRIGKTTLITNALRASNIHQMFYVQIPDSDSSGVLQAVHEAMEDFSLDTRQFKKPGTLKEFARLIGDLNRAGIVVILDEFQYFHRKGIYDFCSFLQAEVDVLRDEQHIPAGLFVLGSIHNEMMAILEDRHSPLYNRVTHRLPLQHFSFSTLHEMWTEHGIENPEQRLFLWSLFEGVPKYYRDCFEEGVLVPGERFRQNTLEQIFFRGASPLRNEAENWFLGEFRGRYESLLKIISTHNGCSHAEIVAAYKEIGGEGSDKQLGGYIQALVNKFQIIEKRQPIFSSKGESRKSRYYVTDNFLSSWLAAIDRQIKAARVVPLPQVIEKCSDMLETVEGFALEKMVRLMLEELSRSGLGPMTLTDQIRGYWNRSNDVEREIEIDFVGLNEQNEEIHFGSCKRNSDKHLPDARRFQGHIERFLATREGRAYAHWKQRRFAFSPRFRADTLHDLLELGIEAYGLDDLFQEIGRNQVPSPH